MARTGSGYHIYEFHGSRYPSVTTILERTQTQEDKEGLEDWRRNFSLPGFSSAEDYTQYTSTRGTLVHYNVLNKVTRSVTGISLDPSDLPPSSKWWTRREQLEREIPICRQLWDDIRFDIHPPFQAEVANYHPDKKYAGTPDLRANIDGIHTVLDIKTSSGLRDKHVTQIAAYIQMLNSWNCHIERGLLVYLNPKMKKALIHELIGKNLEIEIDYFNEKLEEFWRIPSVMKEYQ